MRTNCKLKRGPHTQIPGTQSEILNFPFLTKDLSVLYLFISELCSQQHLKLINAQIAPKMPANSPEFLIFFASEVCL